MIPNTTFATGVIMLGAGASLRMGRPKLLLPWRDTTVIGHLIRQWRELGVAQLAIVLRADDQQLMAELERLGLAQENCIINPEPGRGMFSSIICAASWPGWRRDISCWAIVLGDQPHLQTESLRRLLEYSASHPQAICQPATTMCVGHPVMLPRRAFEELKSTPAATLKEFLNLTVIPRVQCPVNEAGLALDLDTPEDYKQLIAIH
jgi:molybdenum cofactor cytidylyltransferase